MPDQVLPEEGGGRRGSTSLDTRPGEQAAMKGLSQGGRRQPGGAHSMPGDGQRLSKDLGRVSGETQRESRTRKEYKCIVRFHWVEFFLATTSEAIGFHLNASAGSETLPYIAHFPAESKACVPERCGIVQKTAVSGICHETCASFRADRSFA